MINWLKKILFGGCEHHWVIIREIQIVSSDDRTEVPIGSKYILRCDKCGTLKTFKNY